MKAFTGGHLTTIPIQSPEWELTLKFKINNIIPNAWKNIVQITNGEAYPSYGNRLPILVLRGSLLLVSSAVNSNHDFWHKKYSMSTNTVYNIKVHQYYIGNGNYKYEVLLDGLVIKSAVNSAARQFYNMVIYALQSSAADVDITDLKFTNFV